MRKTLIALVAMVALAATGCQFVLGSSWQYTSWRGTWEGQVQLEGHTLILEGFNGNITVEVWDRPEIDVRATWNARVEDFDFAPVIEISSDGTRIAWDGTRNELTGVGYVISVPAGINLDLNTSNGKISVSGQGLADLTARSSNGSVLVDNAGTGQLIVRTSNSLVRIDGWRGDVDCITSNGAIHAYLGLVERGNYTLTTSNGAINLVVDKSSRFNFQGSTSNAAISSNLTGLWSIPPAGKSFSGSYNGGGATISASTSNSSISIQHR